MDNEPRLLSEYHEDMGAVTWWCFSEGSEQPLGEPAWIGQPNDSNWPGYHTHFTPHPPVPRVGEPATQMQTPPNRPLAALLEVLRLYDLRLSYTRADDGIHITSGGEKLFVGWLDDLDGLKSLQEAAERNQDEPTGKND